MRKRKKPWLEWIVWILFAFFALALFYGLLKIDILISESDLPLWLKIRLLSH